MVEVIHEHDAQSADSSGMGFLLGILALIVFIYLLFVYGLPMLRGGGNNTGTSSGTQINVPDKLDVNVNQGGQ